MRVPLYWTIFSWNIALIKPQRQQPATMDRLLVAIFDILDSEVKSVKVRYASNKVKHGKSKSCHVVFVPCR